MLGHGAEPMPALSETSNIQALGSVLYTKYIYFFQVAGLVLLVAWGAGGVEDLQGSPWMSFHFLATGVMLFACLVGWALWRTKAGGPTVWGMRLSVTSLFLAMTMGTFMVGYWSQGESMLGIDRVLALETHLGLAFFGWVGGLLVAVSWQVIPMFYLTPEAEAEGSWLVFLTLAASVVGVLFVLLLSVAGQLEGAGRLTSAIFLAPAALVLWVVHPWKVLRLLRARRRKRVDPSALFWRTGMALGPLTLFLAVSTVLRSSDWYGLAFVWCAVLGWAGFVVHGMLTRIGPFLVWFHRFSPLVGIVETPPMRRMLSDRMVWTGYGLHLAALVLGLVAITFHDAGASGTWAGVLDGCARAAGVCLAGFGCVLGHHLWTLWRLRPDERAAELVGPAES